MSAVCLSSLLSEIKILICQNLNCSDLVALFTVDKEWAEWREKPDFWKHRLLIDFAIYTGDKVPSPDSLDQRRIESINNFFQKYCNRSPFTEEQGIELYQPLSEENVAQGFYNAYKNIYTFEHKPLFVGSCAIVFHSKDPSQRDLSAQILGFNNQMPTKNDMDCSRRLYQFASVLENNPVKRIEAASKAIKDAEISLKRSRYLRIFLYTIVGFYAIAGIVLIFAALKVTGINAAFARRFSLLQTRQ